MEPWACSSSAALRQSAFAGCPVAGELHVVCASVKLLVVKYLFAPVPAHSSSTDTLTLQHHVVVVVAGQTASCLHSHAVCEQCSKCMYKQSNA